MPKFTMLSFLLTVCILLSANISKADIYLNGVLISSTNLDEGDGVRDGSGGAIIYWPDNRHDPYASIYAQMIDAVCNPQWTMDGQLVFRHSAYTLVVFCEFMSDGQGGAIAWIDTIDDSTFVQRLGPDGTRQWNGGNEGGMYLGKDLGWPLGPDGSGGFLYTINTGVDTALWVDKVGSDGEIQWFPPAVVLDTMRLWYAAGAPDDAGGAYVAWCESPTMATAYGYSAKIQRISSLGTTEFGDFGLPLTPDMASILLSGWPMTPVISDGSDDAIVLFGILEDPPDGGVCVQKVCSDGGFAWGLPGVHVVPSGHGGFDAGGCGLFTDGAGGAIVVWERDAGGLAMTDIYCQRIDNLGTVRWGESGAAVCTELFDQTIERVVADGTGGVVISWKDYRGYPDFDYYAQRIDSDGDPVWQENGIPIHGNMCVTDGNGGAYYLLPGSIYANRINGEGQPLPFCEASFDSIDFDTIMVGEFSDTTLFITNVGGDTLTGVVSESCPHYSIIDGAGPFSLASAETLDVTVRFEPDSDGAHLCSIAIGNVHGDTVYCSGTGAMVTDVPESPAISTIALHQNYPNPFNPVTTIRFDLPRAVHVRLCVYNVKGELVATLVDRHMAEGRKTVTWTATSEVGGAVASGIYFYRLVAGEFEQTKKMVLLR